MPRMQPKLGLSHTSLKEMGSAAHGLFYFLFNLCFFYFYFKQIFTLFVFKLIIILYFILFMEPLLNDDFF
jgi:hypothetical protein